MTYLFTYTILLHDNDHQGGHPTVIVLTGSATEDIPLLHSGRHFIAHVNPPTHTTSAGSSAATTIAATTAQLAACSLSQSSSSLIASLSTYLATTNCLEVSIDLSAICAQKIIAAKLQAEENQMDDNDYEGFLTSDSVFSLSSSSSSMTPQVRAIPIMLYPDHTLVTCNTLFT